MVSIPSGLRYSKEHEWVRTEGGLAVIGITDYAQKELGDIVFVDLPAVGRKISRGGTLGSVESVKAVSDVYSPASGTVEEVNAAVSSDPAAVNKDPYGAGWMVKIRMDDPSELDSLLDAEAYGKFIESAKG
ncbi:MAG: glycine cleavage system protein GcvH [Planctomycetota bacterium]|nr:glycine cleavage system protein GcvH [Planctomycetota bacterium]